MKIYKQDQKNAPRGAAHTYNNQGASRQPPVQAKKADPKKGWGTDQFFDNYKESVSTEGLGAEEKTYFSNYEKAANTYLQRPNQKWTDKTDMTGKMLSDAALQTYLKYDKDISKVIPVEFALAQAQKESHFNVNKRASSTSKNNPFNVGEFDSHTRPWVDKIENTEQGTALYYDLMAEDYLSHQGPEELAGNMKNENGLAYASAEYTAYMPQQMSFIRKYVAKQGIAMPDASTITGKASTEAEAPTTTAAKPTAATTTAKPKPKPKPTKSGVVTASSLNIRKGPGTSNATIGESLPKDSPVTIYETAENGWHRIGENRWVSGKYVNVVAAKQEKVEEEKEPEKQGPDLKAIAQNVYDAMNGLGTDESKVYSNLGKLNKDAALIEQVIAIYKSTFKSDLVADIRGDFSNTMVWGNQLDKALGLLNLGGNKVEQAEVKPKEDEKQSAAATGMKEIIDQGTDKHATDQAKSSALAEYARKQYAEYPAKIKAFKDQEGLTPDQKVAIIGKLAVEVAKMEYYMGTVFYKGGKWEQKFKDGAFSKSSNKGEYVDHYTKQSSYNGKRAASPWCTKFATYTKSAIGGLRASHHNSGESRRGVWGGSQLSNGHENFWDYDTKKGGNFMGQTKRGGDNIFSGLKTAVAGKTAKADKIAEVKSFFDKNYWPQTGDIMITGTSNNFKHSDAKNFDSSHTTLIEKVDVTDDKAMIYTIEGNAGDMVKGVSYDLTNTSHLGKIVNISRLSLDNYGKSENIGEQKDIKTIKDAPKYDEKTLMKPLQEMNKLLKEFANSKGVINNAGATIADQTKAASSSKTQ